MTRLQRWTLAVLVAIWPMSLPAVDLFAGTEVGKDIVQLSPDTYLLHRGERPFASHEKQKEEVVADAQAFAARMGKGIEEISFDEKTHEMNQFYTAYSWDYKFRLVDAAGKTSPPPPVAPAAASSGMAPAAPAAVAAPAPAAQQPTVKNERTRRVDELYEQLIKLDELRQRGILTDAEFQAEKHRLLEAD